MVGKRGEKGNEFVVFQFQTRKERTVKKGCMYAA